MSPDWKPELVDKAKPLPPHMVKKKPKAATIDEYLTPVKRASKMPESIRAKRLYCQKKEEMYRRQLLSAPKLQPKPSPPMTSMEVLSLETKDKEVIDKYCKGESMFEAPPTTLKRSRAMTLSEDDINGMIEDVKERIKENKEVFVIDGVTLRYDDLFESV